MRNYPKKTGYTIILFFTHCMLTLRTEYRIELSIGSSGIRNPNFSSFSFMDVCLFWDISLSSSFSDILCFNSRRNFKKLLWPMLFHVGLNYRNPASDSY